MGRHLSPRYGQVMLVSRYPVLTAVNWSQHLCAICVQYQFPCAPKLARECEVEHWCRPLWCGGTGGRCTVMWLPNFLGWVDLLSYGALLARAWSSAIIKYCKWVFIIIKIADCNLYRWLTDSLLFLFSCFVFSVNHLFQLRWVEYSNEEIVIIIFKKDAFFDLLKITCNRLTTSISLWTPSKILDSLRQILKLSSRESSIQTAIASWGLSGVLWLGVTSMTGGDRKGWKQPKGDIS